MLLLIFVVLLFSALQLLCCLKWKRKFAKALPLLVVLLFICVFFALTAGAFSLPNSNDTAAFQQQDELFVIFFSLLWFGVFALLGELFGWLIYGILLLARSSGDKHGTRNRPPSHQKHQQLEKACHSDICVNTGDGSLCSDKTPE